MLRRSSSERGAQGVGPLSTSVFHYGRSRGRVRPVPDQGRLELLDSRRLDQVRVEPGLDHTNAILLLPEARHRDETDAAALRAGSHRTRDLQAIELRQPDIHYGDVGRLLEDQVEPGAAVACGLHVVTPEAQKRAHRLANVLAVVD